MKLSTDPKVLKCLLAINLDINIWTARRKLNPDDFKHSDLPPEQLATLGSKKICDPKELRIFGTLKARAVNLLDRTGVRFLGGWALPENKSLEIMKQLDVIAEEFRVAKENFIKNYDQAVQNWISHNAGWEQIIQNSVVSANYVEKRIGFNYQLFKVVNPTGKQRYELEKGLQNEVTNLGGTLFDEIAKAASEAYNKSYQGKTEITRKALSPLKNIREKLSDLSFVEPRVNPVAKLIDSALNKIPKRGAIIDTDLLMLQGLLLLLTNTNSLTTYAQEILDGKSNDDILSSLIKVETKVKEDKQAKFVEDKDSIIKLDSMGLW